MTTSSPTGTHTDSSAHRPQPAVITSARGASSAELSQRVRRYTYAMAFRMVCFLAMIVVDGWLRWVLLAVAVFMPYLAVVLANQSDQRSAAPLDTFSPTVATAITTGRSADAGYDPGSASGEVIEGVIISADPVEDLADVSHRPSARDPFRPGASSLRRAA
jgi:hypothetical protein